MNSILHDPTQCVKQLRQVLSADKLPVGFFLGAGCPCAIRIPNEDGKTDRPLIPDIRGLTKDVYEVVVASAEHKDAYGKLSGTFKEDGTADPTVETMLNRIRSLREVAGKSSDVVSIYLRRIYRTLLTRPLRSVRVYSVDTETRAFLRSKVELSCRVALDP